MVTVDTITQEFYLKVSTRRQAPIWLSRNVRVIYLVLLVS